jgi:hypothetical protein
MQSKQALLFEKRSKNFYLLASAFIKGKGFLVLFCKKELLASLTFPETTGYNSRATIYRRAIRTAAWP